MSTAPDELDLRLLQPLLREFVAEIGIEKTMRVVERCGGMRTYFPREPGPDHWLSQLIGQAEARKLGRICGSDPVDVPKAMAALRDVRDRRFLEAREATSLNKAAKAFGLSRRAAYQIAARRRQEGGAEGHGAEQQPRLFE